MHPPWDDKVRICTTQVCCVQGRWTAGASLRWPNTATSQAHEDTEEHPGILHATENLNLLGKRIPLWCEWAQVFNTWSPADSSVWEDCETIRSWIHTEGSGPLRAGLEALEPGPHFLFFLLPGQIQCDQTVSCLPHHDRLCPSATGAKITPFSLKL